MKPALPEYLSRISSAPSSSVAVRWGAQEISYRQLHAAAAAVGGALADHGLEPGARVGICMSKGPLPLISLLGTLLAGYTYVPLDRSYPPQRLQRMAEVAELALLLTDATTEGQIAGTTSLSLDLPALLEESANGNVPTATTELAYIIFTSGSTGTPKAVAMPHQALDNLISWQALDPSFDKPARVLQFTPISFDVHFQEIFHTWAYHGEVVVIDDETRRDPARTLQLLEEQGVERIYLPYVALSQLAEAAVAAERYPQSLQEVVTAGEQLVVNSAVCRFFENLNGARLHNQYGPSETHVVTAHTLDGAPSNWPELPPIGQPIRNCWIRIMDSDGHPVAEGEPGELFLGGQCLASGYFGAPDLTAQRFVETDQGRAYRTGDLASVDSQQTYTYLGRADDQLKIRGHRVEPGEVEAAILNDPAVHQCAVVARQVSQDERALMAYLVLSADDGSSDTAELRQWQEVWDGTYLLEADDTDPTFDIRGWNSSYDGKPLAQQAMRTWLQQTCERISLCQPQRVLELGSGTGLFLFALAEQCEHYHATDYSPVSADLLSERLQQMPNLANKTVATRLAAHEAHSLKDSAFDTIILNSLTQHFVSADYLLDVVASTLDCVADGGHVFFGDITAASTRALYYTSVEVARATPDTHGDELRDRVSARLNGERELVLDPRFFLQLPERFPQISDVQIQLKGAGYENELANFRFDVTLTVAGKTLAPPLRRQATAKPWAQFDDIEAFAGWLHGEEARSSLASGEGICLQGVPNARVQYVALLQQLLHSNAPGPISELQQRAAGLAESEMAVDPGRFQELALPTEARNLETWFSTDAAKFDVVIWPKQPQVSTTAEHCFATDLERSLASYASTPVNASLFATVEKRLRRQLGGELPEYMLPARFVALSALPLTPSGKIDRGSLPKPTTQRPALEQAYVAPTSKMETTIAGIWCERLLLDDVGVNDNFFDLGGTSIASLKVMADLGHALARPVAVVALFQHPTIAALSRHLEQADGRAPKQNTGERGRTAAAAAAAGQQKARAAQQRRRQQRRDSHGR